MLTAACFIVHRQHDSRQGLLQTIVDRNDPATSHHKPCTTVHFIPQIDKYITTGKDSTFRVWNCQDLKQLRTINNGSEWINDLAYLEEQRKVVLVSMDRSISYYDINRGSYDLTGRCACSQLLHVVLLQRESAWSSVHHRDR